MLATNKKDILRSLHNSSLRPFWGPLAPFERSLSRCTNQGKGGKSAHDPDASWTKKYDKSYFGYKMHIGVDQHSGVIRKKVFTPANIHDSQCFEKLVIGDEDMAYADKAYTSTKNDAHLKQLGVKNGTLFKQVKKLPVYL